MFYLVIAEVMFNYDAKQDDELSLRKGEIVEVLAQVKEGWWQGSLNGKKGLFPSNFVELKKGSIYMTPANEEPCKLKLKIM